MDWKQLRETVLDPSKRELVRITLSDAEQAANTVDLLMGKDVVPRRTFIEENANSVDLNLL